MSEGIPRIPVCAYSLTTVCVAVQFAEQYLEAQALLVGAALGIVFINTLLLIVLEFVTKFERQDTNTAYHRSVAVKVFFALFINTGELWDGFFLMQ